MYTKDMETEIITRTETATRLIRELTTAFAMSGDHSVEALKSYSAAMEEHSHPDRCSTIYRRDHN